jgi:hypothetical protein
LRAFIDLDQIPTAQPSGRGGCRICGLGRWCKSVAWSLCPLHWAIRNGFCGGSWLVTYCSTNQRTTVVLLLCSQQDKNMWLGLPQCHPQDK